MNIELFKLINNLAYKNSVLDVIMIAFSKYVPYLFMAVLEKIKKIIEDNKIVSAVDGAEFSIKDIDKALNLVAKGDINGKVVIYHFFEKHKSNASEQDKMIKKVDLGIALSHFHQTVLEHELTENFEKKLELEIEVPENTNYIISWNMVD